jgi:type II secretion system protein N
MSEVVNVIKSFGSMLWRNKWRALSIIPIAIAWVLFIFPYSDLRSVVATTVSRTMGDGTAIDFEHVSLLFGFPFALEVQNFEFMGPGLPLITADRLVARPSISAVLTQSPLGSIEAEGLYHANVVASLHAGDKLKKGGSRQEIKAEISGLELSVLTEALRRVGKMAFNIQGTLDTNANLSLDPSFDDQPIGDVFLQAKSVSIPSVAIPVPNMGPVQTPSLQFGRIELKGRMAEGKVQIDTFSFGQGKDSLSGRVRGELGLLIKKEEARTTLVPGSIDLRVELNISKSLMDAMTKSGVGLVLLMVEKFKTISGETFKYAFRVRAPAMGAPPVFEAIPAGQ